MKSLSRPPSPLPAVPGDAGLSENDRRRLLADLRDVVVALDSRVVHPERPREPAIAAEASALRHAAVLRIGALESDDPDR